jgi:hypothetical protein
VPAHLSGEPRLGVAFLIAAALLLAAAIAIALRPWDRRVSGAAALLLGGLMVAYLATRTTGIPLLDREREAVDAVGVATIVLEAAGLAAALWLMQPVDSPGRHAQLQEVSNDHWFSARPTHHAHACGPGRTGQHDRRSRHRRHA